MIESSETSVGKQQNADESSEISQTEEPKTSTGELKKHILDLEGQLKEKENKYMYLYADFENFKKRTLKERSELQKFGWESVARDLLQTLDNLERALSHVPLSTDKNLIDGLKMVLNQFKGSLQKQGVQHIESLEKPFDPNLHEAVGQEKSDLAPGTVVKEHARGYTLHGRLLRPAQVIISDDNQG